MFLALLKMMLKFKRRLLSLVFVLFLLTSNNLLDSCLRPAPPVLAAAMPRQAAPPTPEAVLICRLHTPPTQPAVDIGPTILTGARGARVTVNISHVSPGPALVTEIVRGPGQLQRGEGDVCEDPGKLEDPIVRTRDLHVLT